MGERIDINMRGSAKFVISGVPVSLYSLGLALVTYLGAALRFKALTFQSLWYDELLVTHVAHRSLGDIIAHCSTAEMSPPFFHITLWAWQKAFGVSELSARALPAVFGTLSIVAVYFLGRELFSRRAGLFAALLLAVNPFHLAYSQEVRPYGLLILLAVLSYLFFVRQARAAGWKNAILYLAVSVPLVYTHYFGLLVVASQAVFVCLALPFPGWPGRARFLIFQVSSFLAVGLIYLPWLPRVLSLAGVSNLWTPRPEPIFFREFFDVYFGPETLVAFGLSILLLMYFAGRRGDEEFEQSKLLLLVWSFVVLFVPYIRSFGHPAPLSPRYAIVALPAMLLAAGRGWQAVREGSVRLFLVLSLTAMSLVGIFLTRGDYYRIPSKQQYRQATRYIIDRDPGKKYPVVADVLFDYYLDKIHRFGSSLKLDLKDQPEKVDALCRDVQTGRARGYWLLEFSFAEIADSSLFRLLKSRLFLSDSRDFLMTRASLFVGPGDFAVTSRNVSLPFAWLKSGGREDSGSSGVLTLSPSTSVSLPELKLGPGRYGLTVYGQSLNRIRFRLEGDPVRLPLEPLSGPGEARVVFEVPEASRRRLVLETIPAANHDRAGTEMVEVWDIKLQEIVLLPQFLEAAPPRGGQRTLVVVGGQHAPWLLSPSELEQFRRLGLTKFDYWNSGVDRVGFVAVIRDGRVIYENAGNAELKYRDKRLYITVRNDIAHAFVDGVEHVRSRDGLNLILIDGTDISSYFCLNRWEGHLLVEQ